MKGRMRMTKYYYSVNFKAQERVQATNLLMSEKNKQKEHQMLPLVKLQLQTLTTHFEGLLMIFKLKQLTDNRLRLQLVASQIAFPKCQYLETNPRSK